MNKIDKKTAALAFRSSLPVLTGYIFLGMGFGILMSASGYGVALTLCMSLFIYAGSLQYVCVGLLTGGASFLTVALTSLAVNARHIFYGISMTEKYRGAGKLKPYLIFALTDETYALAVSPPDMPEEKRNAYYFLVSLFDHIYWVTGSVLGGAAGMLIKINTNGIDFALTALFITIVCRQWTETKNHFSALTGVICSVLCLPVFGRESFLIPAMLLIASVLLLGRRFSGVTAPGLTEKGGERDE